jgi:glucosamine--fructose-6-phosphate aminotransferase (isomerizing)
LCAVEGHTEIEKKVDRVMVRPLQLYAYYVAVTKGCDVDKPRNLAKSIAVE